MEILLNRWRGTGDIFKIGSIRITGTILYALYLGLLFGAITQSIYVGIFSIVGFLAGESFGWGKWVGTLCYPETKKDLQLQYDDLEGYNFPYIHYIANFIVKERESFFHYCRVALAIRGSIWAMLIYLPLFVFGYLEWYYYTIVIIFYGIGFPLACYLSNIKTFFYKSRFVNIYDKWETQEVYYGFVHFLCTLLVIATVL